MMTDNEELVERLLATEDVDDGKHGIFQRPRNPDGKAAATLIEQLRKEVERLEGALRPFAKAGELFTGPPTDFDQCIYAPAAGDEYALSGNDLREARAALTGEHNG